MVYFWYGYKGCSECGGKGYTVRSWCSHVRCSLCEARTEAAKERVAKRVEPIARKIDWSLCDD